MRMRHRITTALVAIALTTASAGTALATNDDHDEVFLTSVHRGNLAEIAAGRDAQSNGATRCVKDLGQVLVRDHTRLDQDTKTLADKLRVTLPRSVSAQQEQDLKDLRKKARTPRYDDGWLRSQDTGHVQALDLVDYEIEHGRDSMVRDAARKARPVIAKHLDMIRDCMMGHQTHHR
ncbi:DUF4142 domain-containing protein [Streptomyces orinoci]|uniref:DUF4142 domain-containing protein n=1 Tax=Streptomyces orinoci TaxID=67339 RepID=A0ABV3JYR4_STRON|nr:DUF4142 domain-containing protein [Streptomyces orinoci]